jgi:SpoVK/Ycf46/Vps4 family AAA+-type ATPase
LPDAASRTAFLESALSQPEMESDISPEQLQQLAAKTEGYSGSDLAAVCRQAAMAPVRALFKQTKALKRRRTSCAPHAAIAAASCESAGVKTTRLCETEASLQSSAQQSQQHQHTCGPPAQDGPVTAFSNSTSLWGVNTEHVAPGSAGTACETACQPSSPRATPATLAVVPNGACDFQSLPKLRKLMIDDFVKALQTVKPALQDAGCMLPEP